MVGTLSADHAFITHKDPRHARDAKEYAAKNVDRIFFYR
jgi:hypothetical protein